MTGIRARASTNYKRAHSQRRASRKRETISVFKNGRSVGKIQYVLRQSLILLAEQSGEGRDLASRCHPVTPGVVLRRVTPRVLRLLKCWSAAALLECCGGAAAGQRYKAEEGGFLEVTSARWGCVTSCRVDCQKSGRGGVVVIGGGHGALLGPCIAEESRDPAHQRTRPQEGVPKPLPVWRRRVEAPALTPKAPPNALRGRMNEYDGRPLEVTRHTTSKVTKTDADPIGSRGCNSSTSSNSVSSER